jgi:hypothetical protein
MTDMAKLFGVKTPAISKHVKNIYATRELSPRATVSKMEAVCREGRRQAARTVLSLAALFRPELAADWAPFCADLHPVKKALNKYHGPIFVIPAKAGIQWFQRIFWMPAFAGMTTKELVQSYP